jgi:hypothetical protein
MRDTITVTTDDLERWVFEAAQVGRTLTIDMRPDHAELRMGTHTFVAPLAIPTQRAGDDR